jgi:hypothetical protein
MKKDITYSNIFICMNRWLPPVCRLSHTVINVMKVIPLKSIWSNDSGLPGCEVVSFDECFPLLRRHYFLRNPVNNSPKNGGSRPSRPESSTTKLWQLPNRAKYRQPKDLPSPLAVRLTVQKSISLDVKSVMDISKFLSVYTASVGRDSSVDVATHYMLEVVGIESLWTRDFPNPSRPALGPPQPPIQWVTGLSRGKSDGTWRWPPTPSSAEIK